MILDVSDLLTRQAVCFTNKVMRNAWLFVFVTLAVLVPTQSVFASVVINEVLFNPSGSSDTGLEKIELYNNGSSAVDMSGWELYPGYSSGYFVFPQSFALAAKSFVSIHLKLVGTNDAANLFHAVATADNMGDSSGSVALFSMNGHPEDSIVDFVRYHKPGSSEKKTWESAAAKVGLWVAGEFVAITSLGAGSSITLSTDGIRGGISSWGIAASPTIGSSNTGLVSGSGSSAVSDSGATIAEDDVEDSETPVGVGLTPPPSLKVYAGEDRTAFQGTLLEFRGRADGINGEPLTSGRFSWNFGDGTVREGRITLHTYYFPGTYNVSLNVSSGEYSGSGYLKVIVVRPDLVISEAKSGERGFIELYNNTIYRLDLGGFYLKDGVKTFVIERDTYINPKSALVFSNIVTGLLFAPWQLSLQDAHNFVIETADFSSRLLPEESFERVSAGEQKFVKTKTPTPGVHTLVAAAAENEKGGVPIPADLKRDVSIDTKAENALAAGEEQAFALRQSNDESRANIATSGSAPSFWLLGASIVIGLLAAGGFLFFRLL